MNKKEILNAFKNLNVRNTTDLYDFLIENKKAVINNQEFDLKNSKDTMSFMYMFVSALGLNSIRFNFKKENFEHWFLAFNENGTWYYFETVLKDETGQFSFLSYDELVFFITKKLNSYKGSKDDKYVLKDFQDGDDIDSEGVELLVSDSLNLTPEYSAGSNKSISFLDGSGGEDKDKTILLFFCGFGVTILIGSIILGIMFFIIMQNR